MEIFFDGIVVKSVNAWQVEVAFMFRRILLVYVEDMTASHVASHSTKL